MYDLPYHKEPDQEKLFEFIEENPFAFLIGCTKEGLPVCTQIPILLVEKKNRKFLIGHFMKNTDHHRAFQENAHCLVVFTSAHSYVSASWYSNPSQGSTWNYMSIHVEGKLNFLNGNELDDILKKTSLRFEDNDKESPSFFENLPLDYREKVMRAIVGFEVEISEMKNVFKLSQDKDEKSFNNIISRLRFKGKEGNYIATEMEKRKKSIFSNTEKK